MDFARNISVTHNLVVSLGRKDLEFFVNMPDEMDLRDVVKNECEPGYFEIEDNYPDVQELLEAKREVREEIFDYADAIEKSEDDGWFYDDTEGDNIDNLVDPNS